MTGDIAGTVFLQEMYSENFLHTSCTAVTSGNVRIPPVYGGRLLGLKMWLAFTCLSLFFEGVLMKFPFDLCWLFYFSIRSCFCCASG